MMLSFSLTVTLVTVRLTESAGLVTCPGFPGYCSEAFPGTTCNVVCDRGRNNVPLCQGDGTWTDIPRCIEHDPGVEEQIPGICPGISGYCSQGFLNQRCKFDCRGGPDIDSLCTQDGTWFPYPTCQGDVRETQDGCDGCPGPRGGFRNRTEEQILAQNDLENTISDARRPKVVVDSGARKNVPSFAGNINIGRVEVEEKEVAEVVEVRRTPVKSVIRIPGRSEDTPRIDTIENRVEVDTKTKPTFRKPTQDPARFRTIPPQKKFGVFEAVSLGQSNSKPSQGQPQGQQTLGNYFGEFQTVNLNGR